MSMIRHRNGDRGLRDLERDYRSDHTDLSAYIAILAARRRAGIPVNRGVPPADAEAHALLIEAMIETGMTTWPRVVMAARLGHEAAKLAAPGWAATRLVMEVWRPELERRIDVDWTQRTDRRESIGALGDVREIASFTLDCVERVIEIFDRARPNDMRPRSAIEAARTWVMIPSDENVYAAYAASAASSVASSEALTELTELNRVERQVGNRSHSAEAVFYAASAATRATDVVSGEDYSNSAADAVWNSLSASIFNSLLNVSYVDLRNVGGHTSRIERLWQCSRLAQYLLGEITLPSIQVKNA